MSTPAHGDVWWAEASDLGRRPMLVVTRDVGIPVLSRLLVAPVTRTIRSIPTEVRLGADEGLPTECVASFDNLQPNPACCARRASRLAGQHPSR
ncbi:MAG: type II toxin-antitoxin system PemK/MazF family toxin [Actinomycetota bacterium]|nr:type II toxin-antitoxin system PemK/MazF family toxin [Actinomycetota bacterium]